jgi:CubicO group peptidase (beta-lactamase class C family)
MGISPNSEVEMRALLIGALALSLVVGCGEAAPEAPVDVTADVVVQDTAVADTYVPDVATEDIAPEDTPAVDPFSGVEAFVLDQLTQAQIPGLAAAVTRRGEVVWTGAFGYANVESKRAATVNTPFMLASVSKTVTGVAVMHATQEGHLALDDAINDILPFTVDNPRVENEVTVVRHLVSHTSGIRDNWDNMPYFDGDPTVPLAEFVEGYLVEGGPWYHPTNNFNATMPGENFDYGNVATALAGYVVEHTTDTPFDDYCDTHIFDALGLKNTGWHLEDFDSDTVAMPYVISGGNFQAEGHYGYADYPDGQLRSSVSDMARFLAAISHDGSIGDARVLKKESVEELLSPQCPSVDKTQFVFWYQSSFAGRTVIGHNGADIGVATQMAFAPDTGIGVIVLMNVSWNDGVEAAADAIQELLFDTAEQL